MNESKMLMARSKLDAYVTMLYARNIISFNTYCIVLENSYVNLTLFRGLAGMDEAD